MKSRKITDSERERLYFLFLERNRKNKDKIQEIQDEMDKIVLDTYYKKYLKSKLDREFFEDKSKTYIVQEIHSIVLDKEHLQTIDEEDQKMFPFLLTSKNFYLPNLHGPKFIFMNFLKKNNIYDILQNMILEIAKLMLEDEKTVNKYLPGGGKDLGYYVRKNNFCKGIKTSLQLKNKCPEVYKIYEDIKDSEDIKELRKELGFN